MEITQYIKDLYDLWFEAQANESNPDYEELHDFIYTHDITFGLATLVSLGFVDVSTLPQKSIDMIVNGRSIALEEGFLG